MMDNLTALADVIRALTRRSDKLTVAAMQEAVGELTEPTAVHADVAILGKTAPIVRMPATLKGIGGSYQLDTKLFANWESPLLYIYCDFAEGEISGAPWGAPSTTKIIYKSST